MPRKLGKKSEPQGQISEIKLTKHKNTTQLRKDFVGAIVVFLICLVVLGGVYYFDQASPILSKWSVKIYDFLNL